MRSRPLLSYFLLAYALTWMISVPVALSERGLLGMHIPRQLEALAAFGPFAAALWVAHAIDAQAGIQKILSSLAKWKVPVRWFLVAALSPVALWLLAYAFVSITAEPPSFDSARLAQALTAAGLFELIVIGGMAQGLGEEPGWRGFALPRLRSRWGPLAATLLLFPVWLCWHLPSFLARPEFGWAQWAGFTVGILSAAVWLTLIYDATQSILMAVIWHAVVNIMRGLALAISMPMFLAISNAVLIGAVLIVVYWLIRGRSKPPA